MTFKKTIKIMLGIILFFTLPSLMLFGFIYFKYNEELPKGIQGVQADALANKMLDALNYKAYKNTNYLEWTFKNKHHYKWNKADNKCLVFWKEYKVNLDLNTINNSKVYAHNLNVEGQQKEALIEKALNYFNNDSFWLVAPYKVFDSGVERRLVALPNGNEALLVTYTSGGTTPGDSYLWNFNNKGRPVSYKMWTSILPINGLEASWSDWATTKSGAQLPTFHKLLFIGLDMDKVKGL